MVKEMGLLVLADADNTIFAGNDESCIDHILMAFQFAQKLNIGSVCGVAIAERFDLCRHDEGRFYRENSELKEYK